MSNVCRSGREKSDVVGEEKSTGREEGSGSVGIVSSASKISSMSKVSFSRGAEEHIRGQVEDQCRKETYGIRHDHQCDARSF
jgi:hypothetical protein